MQTIGKPYIENYSRQVYGGGTQNWSIAQNQNGYILVGNNEGLLVYDGVRWDKYSMPNSSMVRSILVAQKGRIYVGAYNDFGLFESDSTGKYYFKSLKKLIPDSYKNFDDIWNVSFIDGEIIFQSYKVLFIYNEEEHKINVIESKGRMPLAFSVSGRLFINVTEEGLFEYSSGELRKLNGCEDLAGKEIRSVIKMFDSDDLLISTISGELYIYNGSALKRWEIPAGRLLESAQLFSAVSLRDRYYAFGTIQDGLIIIDRDGNLVQHINRNKGLQNNTILSLFADRDENLWLGLDNGIDYLHVNSPLTILQTPDDFGSGYVSLANKNKLYMGTNQGLFVTEWHSGEISDNYRLIPGTSGQVWSLRMYNGKIICGHNKGTFLIEGEKAILINDIPGGWDYLLLRNNKEYMIGGTFNGFTLFKYENDTWQFKRRIRGFNESCRIFVEDENDNIWMSHGFKGVFRIGINDNMDSIKYVRKYSIEDGLPSDYTLNVFKLRNRILVSSDFSGLYEYDPIDDRFIYSEFFNRLLNNIRGYTFLEEDESGNIWYVAGNELGLFRKRDDNRFDHITSPFNIINHKFLHSYESIGYISDNHVIIGIEDGFANYSMSFRPDWQHSFPVYITGASYLIEDSLFYYGKPGYMPQKPKYSFPYKNNRFFFDFASPVYGTSGKILFSTYLEGYENNWSEWSEDASIDYYGLREGHYQFNVKAKTMEGKESLVDSLEFTVLTPWYRSRIAKLVYILLFISFVLALIWVSNIRIKISKRKERLKQLRIYREKEKDYRRQVLMSEKRIISMQNEHLQKEMIQRDKELANQAIFLIRKNDFLMKIKEELKSLMTESTNASVQDKISKITSRVKRESEKDQQKEVFNKAFDEVHEAFLNKLTSLSPDLTPNELRICAYLKMNMSTKEIASIMNISRRGVETSRYRIRKKLNLERETNLIRFLIDL